MVSIRQRRLLGGLLLAGMLFSLPLAAQHGGPGDRGGTNGVDLDTTVERIRKETGGRVLHAETLENEGNREHRVRIIDDRGKVRRYRVDAGSGQKVPPGQRRR
jgi:hypothetical protein